MTTTETVTTELIRIAEQMEPAERQIAATTIARLMQSIAIWGADEVIPTGLLLGEVLDLLKIAARDERRAAHRQEA